MSSLMSDSRKIIADCPQMASFLFPSVVRTISIDMLRAAGRSFYRIREKIFRWVRSFRSIGRQVGTFMRDPHFIALIHKDPGSGYGVSFPDAPGIIAVADTLDEAIAQGAAVLAFALEDWAGQRPVPRSLEQLRLDPEFQQAAGDAVVAAIFPSADYYQAAE